MSKKDVTTADYFEDPKHCADLLNGYVFQGEQVISPEQLKEIKPNKSIIASGKTQKEAVVTVIRDVVYEVATEVTSVSDIKDISDNKDTPRNNDFSENNTISDGKSPQTAIIKTTIISLEHQSNIHYAMPARIISSEGIDYRKQWNSIKKKHKEAKDLSGDEFLCGFSKTDRLLPVSTIVLYWGLKPWNGPRCLKDILDLNGLPAKSQDFVADYPLHVIDVRRYPDYERFRTDLKYVFGFLQRDQDKEQFFTYIRQNQEVFSDLPIDAYNLIAQFSHSKELLVTEQENISTGGGKDMCKAITDLINDGIEQGIVQGIEQGIVQGIEQGIEQTIQATIRICQSFGASKETTIAQLVAQVLISSDKANEYVARYWDS